jgi:hypothetical protein
MSFPPERHPHHNHPRANSHTTRSLRTRRLEISGTGEFVLDVSDYYVIFAIAICALDYLGVKVGQIPNPGLTQAFCGKHVDPFD